MSRVRVHLADAPTDVLVFLADAPEELLWSVGDIADAVAPADATDTRHTTANAMRTLLECGLIGPRRVGLKVMWRATDAGRAAVAEARSSDPAQPSAT